MADPDNCFISEITLAELKFGVANSEHKEKNQKTLDDFLTGVKIIPIFHSLDLYAIEKARLRKEGSPIDDFDILIGATAVTHNLTMVTNNTDHFKRIAGIVLEIGQKTSVNCLIMIESKLYLTFVIGVFETFSCRFIDCHQEILPSCTTAQQKK
jgi:tRNA(fMet)-specific endonuclease VapC